MNLLVGATGFVGGHVVEYLFEQGEISRGTFRAGSHLKIMDSSGVQGVEVDMLDHHSLHEAMEGVDVVYNLASPMPGADSDFMKVNTEGILNLLEVSAEAKVKAFIHLSTLDVYGFGQASVGPSSAPAPSDEYQRSKAEAERLLQEFAKRSQSPRVVVVRPARAVGSRDESLVLPLIRMLKSGKVVLPQSGVMSFTHPRDIAQAMYKAATSSAASGSVYLVKSFDSSPADLAASLSSELGLKAEVKKEGLFRGSPLPEYASKQLKASVKIDVQPNWSELGYVPKYDLQATCQEVAGWYKKDPWIVNDR